MHKDLGVIDGPVLLFGGPYSNLQATQAVLAQGASRAIAPGAMICTGDVVAYCAQPVETVQALRTAAVHVVAGNCEKQLASGAGECGCGFEEGSVCDLLSTAWFDFANAQVGASDRAWMATCPDTLSFQHQGARYAVLHGGATDVARFIWSTSPEAVFAQEWETLQDKIGPVDHVIAGHSGIPFMRQTPWGRWINVGVIGMPPHDGCQQTRFGVLDGGEVLIHALRYDVDGAFDQMQRAGLTQGYHDALRRGYWPSEDVLPGDLRTVPLASG